MIYLASQSPRRAQLLEQLGVSFQRLLPDPDEDAEALEAVIGRESAAAYVQRVTALKLDAAVMRRRRMGLPPAPILCADTTVAIGREILGKPVDQAQARQMLTRLSGRTHRVLTAVAVEAGRRRLQALSLSSVTFDGLTPAQIRRYVASGEALGKAGAYAIQGRAAAFVVSIRGSYSGIMGLPLRETALILDQLGLKS
ncbi:MAG: septum formation inhibitor Maf [Betaproteobacteria bacterium]|nr:septum formation inhibitor Maf [Betaproteobacteria bacterium]